jgi:Flp pilus assembly pilin Flp
MSNVAAFLRNVLAGYGRGEDRGVTSVEYALLLALVVVALIAAVTKFSGVLDGVFKGFKF